jgi:hypothetical protein
MDNTSEGGVVDLRLEQEEILSENWLAYFLSFIVTKT